MYAYYIKEYSHTNSRGRVKVTLLQYLQRRHGLLGPKGSHSSAISAQATAQAIQAVQAAAEKDIQVRERRKRGAYDRYSSRDRADIGRYDSQHGVDVAIHVKAMNTETLS